MKTNLEKLNKIASSRKSNWEAKAKARKAGESWLDVSFKIAVEILDALEARGMSQAKLAELMRVTPQQVSKIVKGEENLTLETILKIQNALSIKLLPSTKFQHPVLKRIVFKSHTYTKMAVDSVSSKVTAVKLAGKSYDYKSCVKVKKDFYKGPARSEQDLAKAA